EIHPHRQPGDPALAARAGGEGLPGKLGAVHEDWPADHSAGVAGEPAGPGLLGADAIGLRLRSALLDLQHGLLHPGFGLLVRFDDGARIRARGMDSRADVDLYRAGPLAPSLARPELAGVVGHRDDGHVVGTGQRRTAAAEPDRLTRLDPGAFGEHQHPEALTQPL